MKDLHLQINELDLNDPAQYKQALAEISGQRGTAIPVLLDLLQSPDANVRAFVIHALSGLQHPASLKAIRSGLSDPDLTVRYCALLGLRMQPDPNSIPELIDELQSDDALGRRLAANALIANGVASIGPLAKVLLGNRSLGKSEAARALSLIEHDEIVEPLLAALEDSSPLIDYWAREGLARRGLGMVYFP